MTAVWGPGPEEILQWAARYGAAATLPKLVRRLLLATADLERLEARSDSGVRHPGWDVVAVARTASPFCPEGISGWELSTDAKPRKKATKDIAKREESSPPPIRPADATYVVVTAQRFPNKQQWVRDQRARGAWRDVWLLDVDDLAMWLEHCPAVSHWFASEQLGRPVEGWSDLGSWLRRWEQRTTPPLPADLVLLDREPQATELRGWLERLEATTAPFVRIRAAHREEACLFLAAVVTTGDLRSRAELAGRLEEIEARTLLVESKDAWRVAMTLETSVPLVLVPTFAGFDLGDRSSRHATVVPADPSHGAAMAGDLRIDEPLPWRTLVPRVCALGKSGDDAERLARESQGRLDVLQRLLGAVTKPSWLDREPRKGLVAMLLMGAWEREADADIAAGLGMAADELDAMCADLAAGAEAPIIRRGRGWRWSSHADVWMHLGRNLSPTDLDRFRDVAIAVLGEDDPRYDLQKGERWFAAVHGKVLRHSQALREGLAESLVRLALADPHLVEVHRTSIGSARVEWIVSELLTPRWVRWASLSKLLPVLAEAAPTAFLRAVESSVDVDDGVARLFGEEDGGGLGQAPHVGLLWALETLGWKAELMPRVADILARLAERDPGGALANRPARSLEALFHVVTPQTRADDAAREEVLTRTVERRSEVGWELLLGLLRSGARGEGPLPQSYRPRFLQWDVPAKPELPTWNTVHARVQHVLALVLREAGTVVGRWSRLIVDRYDLRLPPALSSLILAELIARRDRISDDDASIWRALHSRLDGARRAGLETKRQVEIDRLMSAHDMFLPEDPVIRAVPLFRPPYSLSGSYEGWRDESQRLAEEQDTFLKWLSSRDDREQVLGQMLTRVSPEFHALGNALARSSMALEIERKLLYDRPSPPWDALVRGFVARRRYERGFVWLATTMRRLVSTARCDEAVRAALALWSEPEVWALVDEFGDPIRSDYWSSVELIGDQSDERDYARALKYLIQARNVKVALELASHRARVIPTEDLLSTLELVFETIVDSSIHRQNTFSHDVDEIFDELWAREGVDLARAAGLESVLRSKRLGSRREPRFLNRVLEQRPDEFARFVSLVYRPRDATSTEGPHDDDASHSLVVEPGERQKATALWAHDVLSNWKSYPGRDIDDAEQREHLVFEWAEQALMLTRQARRQAVGELEVSRVLARVPEAPDGHWPCLAARRLLETGKHPALARGLSTAKYNQWGMRVRVLDDGAEQSSLAEGYARSAIAVGHRWPRTAALLDDLADIHRRGAEQDAKRAHEDRIAAGESRRPESSTANPNPSSPESTPMTAATLTTLPGLECIAVGPAPSLTVDFAPRLNVITGDNGLGKTFLLDVAWWVLTGTWVGNPAMPLGSARAAAANAEIHLRATDGPPLEAASFDPRSDRWTRPSTWPATDALVIYARVDGGFSIWDPERMAMSGGQARTSALHLSSAHLWDRLERDGVVLCNGLPTDWLQWQARHPEVFERFFSIVRALFAADAAVEPGEAVPLGIEDDREIPTIRLSYGEVPITLLSAGMKRVLGLAYVVEWAFTRHLRARKRRTLDASPSGVVFLFDEVEAHLHPRWQRALLPALLGQLAKLEGSPETQMIATTHAPFVAASCEAIFDEERDDLFVFGTRDDQVVLDHLQWTTYGDITNWVTSPVFGLERGRSLEAERAISAANAFMRGEEPDDPDLRTYGQIHARLRDVLAPTDDFWPLWITSREDGAAQ